jgi:hypothetical protein
VLFGRIAEGVHSSELLPSEPLVVNGGETPCAVVSVIYDIHPRGSTHVLEQSPHRFWVDERTGLVLQHEFSATISNPWEDKRTVRSRQTVLTMQSGQVLDASLFAFTPPAGVELIGGRAGAVTATAVGGSRRVSGGAEQHSSMHWEEDTVVQQSKIRFKGHEITCVRRIRLSPDGAALLLTEEIQGPAGQAAHEFSVPIK